MVIGIRKYIVAVKGGKSLFGHSEWLRMAENGREWPRMAENGREWVGMDGNG